MQTLQRIGITQTSLDILELLRDRLGTRASTPARPVALQGFEVATNGQSFGATAAQGLPCARRSLSSSYEVAYHQNRRMNSFVDIAIRIVIVVPVRPVDVECYGQPEQVTGRETFGSIAAQALRVYAGMRWIGASFCAQEDPGKGMAGMTWLSPTSSDSVEGSLLRAKRRGRAW